MTVVSEVDKDIYVATGADDTYVYSFRILLATDLVVQVMATNGDITTLVLDTDYTVTGVQAYGGGSITLTAGNLGAANVLLLFRDPLITQQTSLQQQGSYSPTSVETMDDKLTMVAQALQTQLRHSIRGPVIDGDASIMLLPSAVQRASQALVFDSLGNATVGQSPASGIISSAMAPVVAAGSLILARYLMSAAAVTVFNVKEYPYLAAGDGLSDDTAPIQAAITACEAFGVGGTVYFPRGDYLLSNELLVTGNGVRLIGESTIENLSGGSRLVQSATNRDVVRISTVSQSIAGFESANLSLYGSNGASGHGMHFQSIVAGRSILGVRLQNVNAKNCKQHGLYFEASTATAFIFDAVLDKIRTVGNFGSGLRADGSVVQVLVDKIYSEGNGASQIALAGVNQTTNPQGWQFNSPTVAQNPAVVGTAAFYLENAFDVVALNVWHESNSNAEIIIKSCKGVTIKDGRVSQAGTCDGAVIGFSGAFPCANINVEIPGWSNTSSKKRVDVSQFAGGSFLQAIRLGQSADGPITPDDVTGYASAFKADLIFFSETALTLRVANAILNGVTLTGTWTIPASFPTSNVRTPAINTVQQRVWEGGVLDGNALINGVLPLKGIKPIRIEVVYEVTGADPGDDVAWVIYTQAQSADGVATPAPVSVPFTYDAAHDTAAKRSNSAGGHQYNRMVLTITDPAWLQEGQHFLSECSVTEANNAANALAVTIRAILCYYYAADH